MYHQRSVRQMVLQQVQVSKKKKKGRRNTACVCDRNDLASPSVLHLSVCHRLVGWNFFWAFALFFFFFFWLVMFAFAWCRWDLWEDVRDVSWCFAIGWSLKTTFARPQVEKAGEWRKKKKKKVCSFWNRLWTACGLVMFYLVVCVGVAHRSRFLDCLIFHIFFSVSQVSR